MGMYDVDASALEIQLLVIFARTNLFNACCPTYRKNQLFTYDNSAQPNDNCKPWQNRLLGISSFEYSVRSVSRRLIHRAVVRHPCRNQPTVNDRVGLYNRHLDRATYPSDTILCQIICTGRPENWCKSARPSEINMAINIQIHVRAGTSRLRYVAKSGELITLYTVTPVWQASVSNVKYDGSLGFLRQSLPRIRPKIGTRLFVSYIWVCACVLKHTSKEYKEYRWAVVHKFAHLVMPTIYHLSNFEGLSSPMWHID